MMDKIIEKFGFESNETVVFCMMAENPDVSDERIKKDFEVFMSW